MRLADSEYFFFSEIEHNDTVPFRGNTYKAIPIHKETKIDEFCDMCDISKFLKDKEKCPVPCTPSTTYNRIDVYYKKID